MGAVALMVWFRTINLRTLPIKGQFCPHFYVVNKKGEKWHFKRKYDLLPSPFNELIFMGEFKQSRSSKLRED
jgi:hypothetical protein